MVFFVDIPGRFWEVASADARHKCHTGWHHGKQFDRPVQIPNAAVRPGNGWGLKPQRPSPEGYRVTHQELLAARLTLGLGEEATLREIKERHRALVKRHHPDSGAAPDEAAIRAINSAYHLIEEYVGSYRISFREADFYEQCPEERVRRQFMTDPIWGSE